MDYKKTVISGVGWMGLLRISSRLVTILKTAVLARILTPADFGLFGAAALSLSLFETLTETGINQAVIYSEKKAEDLLNSAWVTAIIRGSLIAVMIAASAVPLSIFFHDPRLVNLIWLISVVPLVKGFINPMIVVLIKELQFGKETMFRGILLVVDAAAAVAAAVITRSAAAFVIALLVSGIVEVILSFLWFKIRPKFKFEMEKLKEILGYGKWVTLSGVAHWLASELDDFFAGRFFGLGSLGIYQAAYKVSTLPVTEIAGTVNQVTFPVMSKVKNDFNRLIKILFGSMGVIGVIGVIGVVIMWSFPDLVVRVLLGEQWLGAGPLIRVLAVFGLVRSVESGLQPLFLATGKPRVASWGNLIKVAVLVLGLWFLSPLGIEGVAWAALISGLAVIPYYAWELRKYR